MTMMRKFTRLALLLATLTTAQQASAQQTQSRLYEVTKSGVLKVCIWPLYYAISFRNPTSGELEGIDIDLSKELGKIWA